MEETNRSTTFEDEFAVDAWLDDLTASLLHEEGASDASDVESDEVLSDEIDFENDEVSVTISTEPSTSPKPSFSLRKVGAWLRSFVQSSDLRSMWFVRLITAYFAVSGLMILLMDKRDIDPLANWRDFAQEMSLGMILLLVSALTVVLSQATALTPRRYRVIEPLLAIGAILFFDIVTLWQVNNLYLTIAVMIVSLVLMGYALSKLRTHRWFHKLPWWVYGLAGFGMAIVTTTFISIATIHRHYVFGTSAHDFGLFVQMFHSLADDLTAVTSCERDKLMSHFSVHASYIFYALVPFFKAFPREETLLIAQAVLAMGGIVPLILIAKRRGMKGLTLLGMAMAYAFCISLISPCFYDFHENAFMPTLLMWLLWAVDNKKVVALYLCAALVCLVKEDAPLFVICIGLYYLSEHKGERVRFHGLAVAVLSGIYMILMTTYLTNHGDGQMMTGSRFGHLLLSPEGGFAEVVLNTLKDPAYFFSLLIRENTWSFFLEIMLPLLFLPFLTKKLHRYWLMMPFIITNLVIGANYGYAAQTGYQYVFGPVTVLLYLALVNVSDLTPRLRRNIPVLLGAAALIFSIGTISHRIDYVDFYRGSEDYYLQMESTLDSIPEDAVVGADPFYIPHIANIKEVYFFDFNDLNQEKTALLEPDRYDYIALSARSDIYKEAESLIKSSGYSEWANVNNNMVIFKRTQ